MQTHNHRGFIEKGLSTALDIESLIKENDIPLQYIFGSPGIYTRKSILCDYSSNMIIRMSRDVSRSIVEYRVFQGARLLFMPNWLKFCSGTAGKNLCYDTLDGFLN